MLTTVTQFPMARQLTAYPLAPLRTSPISPHGSYPGAFTLGELRLPPAPAQLSELHCYTLGVVRPAPDGRIARLTSGWAMYALRQPPNVISCCAARPWGQCAFRTDWLDPLNTTLGALRPAQDGSGGQRRRLKCGGGAAGGRNRGQATGCRANRQRRRRRRQTCRQRTERRRQR